MSALCIIDQYAETYVEEKLEAISAFVKNNF